MTTDKRSIRTLLIDDQETIHETIGELLLQSDDIDVVGRGFDGNEAIQLCEQFKPDLILMDVSMPVMNGVSATRIIMSRYPQTRILALSGVDDIKVVQQMMAAGAVGYVLKYAPPEELIGIIRTVYAGHSVIPTNLLKPLTTQTAQPKKLPADFGLTRRELQVLVAMGHHGLNNSEVAHLLTISTATVRYHLTNIIEKLGAENRTEALIIAARHGLI